MRPWLYDRRSRQSSPPESSWGARTPMQRLCGNKLSKPPNRLRHHTFPYRTSLVGGHSGDSREFKRLLSVAHVLLLVAIVIWGRRAPSILE